MRWIRLVKIGALGIAGLVTLVGIAGLFYERWARSSALRDFPPPGRLVQLETHALHIDCRGEGAPTIVLESGMDPFGSLSWSLQHARLSLRTRTCAYDRAGIAWSETGPPPRTGKRIASELHELLKRAGESGPFVLVAHSMGGAYARIFAGTYPDDIIGLILIESSHPDQFDRLPQLGGFRPPSRLLIRAVPLLRRVGIMRHVMRSELQVKALPAKEQKALKVVSAGSIATVLSEFGQISNSLARASEIRSLGDLPLLVLSIGNAPDVSRMPDVEQAQADEGYALWVELQHELAALSSTGRVRQISDATHYMQFSQPDAIVEEINAFLDDLQNSNRGP